jgi:hypothetical protein
MAAVSIARLTTLVGQRIYSLDEPVPRPRGLYEDLVDDVLQGLLPLRTIYGLDVSDEALLDRARNVVAGLICNFDVRRID